MLSKQYRKACASVLPKNCSKRGAVAEKDTGACTEHQRSSGTHTVLSICTPVAVRYAMRDESICHFLTSTDPIRILQISFAEPGLIQTL